MNDILSKTEILHNLNMPQKFNIEIFDSIDSTNVYLKELAKKGEKSGTVIIADSQTCGHGRFDRKFHSPKNCGIYMSVLLKPDLAAEQSVLITAATAVAVCDAILALTDQTPQIKWVNDILLNGKKVCGILTEGAINHETLKFDWAVIGIGINVYEPDNSFDNEIKNIATSVLKEKQENFRNKLCAEIINRLTFFCENLENKDFFLAYKEYSAVINKKINVIKNNSIISSATALDIDDNCRLKVQYDDGSTEFLNSGEISIKL